MRVLINLSTEMVVLSACDSGTGKLLKGEGNLSLARGFFNAGCKSALMSLWCVDDCSTSEIMSYFYANLKDHQEKDQAIRNAKIEYLKKASKSKRHPVFWAPFITYGKIDAIEVNSVSPFGKLKHPLIVLGLFVAVLLLKSIISKNK